MYVVLNELCVWHRLTWHMVDEVFVVTRLCYGRFCGVA